MGFGVGLNAPDVNVDLLNGNTPYDFSSIASGLDMTKVADRREARSRLKDLLDGDYETPAGTETTVAFL